MATCIWVFYGPFFVYFYSPSRSLSIEIRFTFNAPDCPWRFDMLAWSAGVWSTMESLNLKWLHNERNERTLKGRIEYRVPPDFQDYGFLYRRLHQVLMAVLMVMTRIHFAREDTQYKNHDIQDTPGTQASGAIEEKEVGAAYEVNVRLYVHITSRACVVCCLGSLFRGDFPPVDFAYMKLVGESS